MRCLLDSDIASEYLRRKNFRVLARAASYLSRYGQFNISLITCWEILRGLRWRKSSVQLVRFAAFCHQNDVLDLDNDIVDTAADLWVGLQNAGQTIGDNDILIAATALHYGLALATRNLAHFNRIPGLTLDDWTRP